MSTFIPLITMIEINSIPITEVLKKLSIEYSTSWNTITLKQNDSWTDGRKGSIKDNYVNDFAWKWRAVWSPYSFVKSHLDLSDKETFQRFNDEFHSNNTPYSSSKIRKRSLSWFTPNITSMNTVTNNITALKSFKYLSEDRAIKEENIAILTSTWNLILKDETIEFTMKDLLWSKVWSQVRYPFNATSPKSKATKGSRVWYYYVDTLDTSEPIIIVEWEIDFISICHLSNNIVGTQWIQSLKDLVQWLGLKWFTHMFLLIDNDEVANKAIESLSKLNLKDSIELFDCRWILWDTKDANELIQNWGEITIENILEQVASNQNRIAIQKKQQWKKELNDISSEFIEEHNIKSVDASYFTYDSYTWLYSSLKKNLIKKFIKDKLCKEWQRCTPALISSVLDFVTMDSQSRELENILEKGNRNRDDIYLNDWIYSVSSSTLRPYIANEYALSKFEYNYSDIISPQEPKLWINFLQEIFEDRSVIPSYLSMIQEWFGYCLLNSSRFDKALILYGSWANGKSVLVDVLKWVIWEENTVSISCEELRKENTRIQLLGKKLILDEDMSHSVQLDSWIIKKIASGQSISWKKLYENSINFVPHWKLVIATNNLPRIETLDDAAKRRFIFLELRQSFMWREDFNLTQKLLSEKKEIFSRAFEWMLKLLERWDFNIPSEVEFAFNKIAKDSDTTQQFLESWYVKIDKTSTSSNKNIMNKYKKYCSDFWFKAKNMNALWRELKKKWFESCKIKWERWYEWILINL